MGICFSHAAIKLKNKQDKEACEKIEIWILRLLNQYTNMIMNFTSLYVYL